MYAFPFWVRHLVVLLVGSAVLTGAGCASVEHEQSSIAKEVPVAPKVSPPPASPVQQASAILPATGQAPVSQPFPPVSELTSDFVIEQVLSRNPTLAQMSAAVQAATARYPQAIALDDPSFTSWIAPGTVGQSDLKTSVRFELSQKLFFPGKRALRGEVAIAQASAASGDLADTRLQLMESARLAFSDYYLAERALEVNDDGLKLLEEFKKNAEARYKTGQTPQQDLLQVEVELGRQSERRLTIQRNRTVARARLNTLMNLQADSALPPALKTLAKPQPIPDTPELREGAVAHRPDLQALMSRVAADQAALALAEREYYPDVEAMAGYNSFMMSQQQYAMVGLRVNLPIRLNRRRGAVAENVALLAQRRAQLAQQVNQVGLEIEQAAAQVKESEQALKLYDERILPAARENVKAAQTAYMTGRVPFLSLIEAQRNLIDLRDRYYLAEAGYQQRRAALERAHGGPIAVPAPKELPKQDGPVSGTPPKS